MDKVTVSRCMIGICHMQVCAEHDATDEEILKVCNSKNPAGTSMGWTTVLQKAGKIGGEPVQCKDYKDRTHFLVAC